MHRKRKRKYKTKKDKELEKLIAMGNVMVEWKLFKGEQENQMQIVKEVIEKPPCKILKNRKKKTQMSKISPLK